jgi:short-subunit dehydrogenase
MASKFHNKVVWITGASSGIGEATAYEFAKAGAKLVLSARRKEELERVKNKTGLLPENVLVLPLDMTDIESLSGKVNDVLEYFGSIDVLFNNAGISQRGSVSASKFDVYRSIMELNFFGVIALTQAVLPVMLRQKSGNIAVTSSISGKLGTPLRSGYCASKHALHGFFDSLRSEIWRENVHVTLICPGYIRTEISTKAVSADGSPHGRMDENQAKGMLAEKCATKIFSAIKANREEVYMGGVEVLGIYLKRFFPRILSRILRNQLPK